MDERRRHDHTRSELLDHSREHRVDLLEWQFDEQHGQEDTQGAGDEDHEQRADSQGHVVVSSLYTTRGLARVFGLAFTDTVSIAC